MEESTWGIVLAGGEGTRVRTFLQQLCGGEGLKQFSTVIGQRSMIQHTLDRVQRLIPPERILIVVSSRHREQVVKHLAYWPQQNLIYQPANRDTAPGILLPLAHISHRDPLAKVVVFPSDHFVLDEEKFMACVGIALKDLEEEPQKLILLGMTPVDGEESEYGYIQVGNKVGTLGSLPVKGFLEKPPCGVAKRLIRQGALWNTMVFAAQACAIWQCVRETASALFYKFAPVRGMSMVLMGHTHSIRFTKTFLRLISPRKSVRLCQSGCACCPSLTWYGATGALRQALFARSKGWVDTKSLELAWNKNELIRRYI